MTHSTRRITTAVLAGALATGVLAYGGTAGAEPRTHDGFYMQAAVGLGYLTASADVPPIGEISYSGMTTPGGLLLGGTVGSVAIGGGFFYDLASSPSVEIGGQSFETDDASLTLIGLGLFADFYPDPHGGLHFQPFLGWGGLEACAGSSCGGSDPTGLVVAIGGGHDWWVGDEWSIGVMGRLAYAPLKLEDTSYTVISPSILATFTLH